MSRALIIHRAGPSVTIQDQGRSGYLAYGVSRGGAADPLALAEGAALLGQDTTCAALEMAGMGGKFEATEDMRIALVGAPMRADIDGIRLVWNASHLLPKGARLTLGGAETGSFSYLHLAGGVMVPVVLGARAAHLAAGIGNRVQSGDQLPVGPDINAGRTGMQMAADSRFEGGTLRVVPSLQTTLFDPGQIARFETTEFRRDTRGNRMGVRLLSDGPGFHSDTGLTVLSEVIVPGDVQITGDGTPFVLLSECQTTGGYPRIGSVLPADLPRIAQAGPGARVRFKYVSLDEAVDIERRERDRRKHLRSTVHPLIRDPHDIADLLSYQLISGATAGDDLERPVP